MMNSRKTLILVLAGLLLAGCAQETGAPQSQVAEGAAAPADQMASAAAAAAAEASADAEFMAMFAAADAGQGKRHFLLCQSCHTMNAGGANKLGPNLAGVVGSLAGQVQGFGYSEALLGAGVVWDPATLNKWLESPARLVPGTTMVFAGIRDPQQRANLIAYLEQGAP